MYLVFVQPVHWYRTSAPLRISQLPWDHLCKQRGIHRTSALPRGYQQGIIDSSIWISFNCTIDLGYECISRWLTLWDGFQQFPRQITFGSQREIALYPINKIQRKKKTSSFFFSVSVAFFRVFSSHSVLRACASIWVIRAPLVSFYAITFLIALTAQCFFNKGYTWFFCIHRRDTTHSTTYGLVDISHYLSSPEGIILISQTTSKALESLDFCSHFVCENRLVLFWDARYGSRKVVFWLKQWQEKELA